MAVSASTYATLTAIMDNKGSVSNSLQQAEGADAVLQSDLENDDKQREDLKAKVEKLRASVKETID
ncbi:hypothetical protein CCR75_006394 [Bremia lactucae]|uniref:Uncharacterized protein n=1 Tax=Bremia lactucae TaxID=4779 RepID=A0A976IK97_BRELC|nr:hypothetical protein CCR75_006394 [Bremia lactucae]